MKKHLTTYAKRDTLLRQLGYSSYFHYLQSPLWSYIRDRILTRDNDSCVLCDQDAVEVHHRSYSLKVLRGDDYRWLVSLCRSCHNRIEFSGRGKKKVKRTVQEADNEFLRLRRLNR